MKTQRSIAMGLTLALIALACGKAGNSTPTEAFQTSYNAAKNADVKAAKSVMPKKMLDEAEKEAKAKNIVFDDVLKVQLLQTAAKLPATMPETRNEKIEGDKATLEYKDGENWRKVNFIKEDDGWKRS